MGKSLSLLDLIQEGNIGLFRAVKNLIIAEVINFLLMPLGGYARPLPAPWPINRARFVFRCIWWKPSIAFQQVQRRLLQDLGRDPTPEELAAEMGEEIEKVKSYYKISQDTVSLEMSVGDDDDDDSSLQDFVEDVKNMSPDRVAGLQICAIM